MSNLRYVLKKSTKQMSHVEGVRNYEEVLNTERVGR